MKQLRFRYRPRLPADIRFWRRVNIADEDECWIWIGARDQDGYGLFLFNATDKHDGKRICTHAHRFAWTLVKGPIPGDLHALHHCDNPPCVNPVHLFLGTEADNAADRDRKGRGATGERAGRNTKPESYMHCPSPPVMYGEANPSAKLTAAAAQTIRADRRTGLVIAKEYHVSKSLVNAIRRGELWHRVINQ